MASYRIGHWADIHHPENAISNSTVRGDLDHLSNTLASDMIVHGGDQLSGREPAVPHMPDSDARDYWETIVGGVSGATDKSYAIPGNHEIPYPEWERISREYIGDRIDTPQVLQPVSGLTVLMINTQSPAIVQGGSDSIGQDYPRIAMWEVEWLMNEVDNAHSRGDVVVVVGHAPLWFASTNSGINSYHPDAPFASLSEAYMIPGDHSYEIPHNYQHVMDNLTARSPVIYLSGHDYQSAADEYRNISGVHHTWQKHYSDGATNFAYCDIDTSTGNVTYNLVSSGTHTETQLMSVTPTW